MRNTRLAVAAHILTLLANDENESLSSATIAGSVNTNPVVVRRLISLLGRAGLVVARTGPGGGSRLGRPANRITLRDVHEAVGDDEMLAIHERPNPACPVGRNIASALSGHLDAATVALRESLDAVTIGDMLATVHAASSGSRRAQEQSRKARRP